LEEEPRLVGGNVEAAQFRWPDVPAERGRIDHPCGPDTDIEGDRLGPGRPLDEMRRRVEMGARVGAHIEPADVADRTVGDGDRQGDVVVRVAGKGWDTGLERNADVDPACGIEGG